MTAARAVCAGCGNDDAVAGCRYCSDCLPNVTSDAMGAQDAPGAARAPIVCGDELRDALVDVGRRYYRHGSRRVAAAALERLADGARAAGLGRHAAAIESAAALVGSSSGSAGRRAIGAVVHEFWPATD